MRLPSGAQRSPLRRRSPSLVKGSGALEPSCATSQISSSPDWSEMNAIFAPSGDHSAPRSWKPEVCVRLRVGPFSIGALNTSPRAVNSARSPLGASE
jgi:hypothetical protein